MTVDKLRSGYLDKKPVLRLSQILEKMNEIDPTFTKQFIEANLGQLQGPPTPSKKVKAASQLSLLLQMVGTEQKDSNLERVKTGFEESL